MVRRQSLVLGIVGLLVMPVVANGQVYRSAAVVPRNHYPAGKKESSQNKVIVPIPLTAKAQQEALAGINQHLADEVAQLKVKIKSVLPDELTVLSGTNGWRSEHQQALVAAMRSGDPTAVYEAWTQGNPQDTAGAQHIARQVEVKRNFSRLEQDVRNKTSPAPALSDLEASLAKLALANDAAADVRASLDTLRTWTDVQKLVETAVPESGAIAKLPTGKVQVIQDPSLPFGTAVVLGNGAVMTGYKARGPINITSANAAEALGLPVVSSSPVPEAQGAEMQSGVLLVNPLDSGGNLRYTVNGNEYLIEPGMSQRLLSARFWTISYDSGGSLGAATYSVKDGTYYFTPTPDGWQLYRQRFDIVFDNSKNPDDFKYLFHGEKMVVPANRTRTISSMYPMFVQFDRGNGSQLVSKALNFCGTVQIGINATDNLWDIFPDDEGRREAANIKLFH